MSDPEPNIWIQLHEKHTAEQTINGCCPYCFPPEKDLSMVEVMKLPSVEEKR